MALEVETELTTTGQHFHVTPEFFRGRRIAILNTCQ